MFLIKNVFSLYVYIFIYFDLINEMKLPTFYNFVKFCICDLISSSVLYSVCKICAKTYPV